MKKHPAAFLIGGLMLALTTHSAMAFDKAQLDTLKSSVALWNDWRAVNPEAKIDLSAASLMGANLSKANLSKANLSGADLSKTLLMKANLSGAIGVAR